MNEMHSALMLCFMSLMGVIMFCFLDYMEVVMAQEPSPEAQELLAEAAAAYHAPDAVEARERIAQRAQRELAEGTLDGQDTAAGWKETPNA